MRTFGGMAPERLAQLIERFSRLRIAVLGDFFLDKYLDIDPSLAEASVETGKTAHQVVMVRHSPGAAGTVVCNLAALGVGTLHGVGFTGDDGDAYDLRKDLTALGCRDDHLVCDPQRMTPVYLKPRDADNPALDGEHDRYDTKNRTPTEAARRRQPRPRRRTRSL
jgi:bifunctional ADP-heptose synthase (sugar kinase/adenylyltransferase)